MPISKSKYRVALVPNNLLLVIGQLLHISFSSFSPDPWLLPLIPSINPLYLDPTDTYLLQQPSYPKFCPRVIQYLDKFQISKQTILLDIPTSDRSVQMSITHHLDIHNGIILTSISFQKFQSLEE